MSGKGDSASFMFGGVLTVNCEGAKDVHSHGFFFRSKPYVSLRVGGQEVRTTAAKHGGSNPVWGQTLRIDVNQEEELHLEVKCQHDGSPQVLGYAVLPLGRVREAGTERVTAPLQRRRRSTGEVVQQGAVSLALRWAPAPAAAPVAVAAYPAPAGGVVAGYPVAAYPQQPPQPQPQQPAAYAPMPMPGPPPQQVQQVVYAQQPMPQPPRAVVAPPPPPPTVVYMPPPPRMPPTTVIYESSHCHGHRHHHHRHHYGHHHHHHHYRRNGYDGGDLVLAGAVGFGLGLLL